MSLARNRIRFEVDVAAPYSSGPIALASSGIQGQSPQFARARATSVEIGVKDLGVWQQAIASTYLSITLELKPTTNRAATPLLRKTLSAADLVSVSENEWINGSKAHATFQLSAADMSFAMPTPNEAELWLVITATTTAGRQTLIAGVAAIIDDGGIADDVTTPTAGTPGYLTSEEILAMLRSLQEGALVRRFDTNSDGVHDAELIITLERDANGALYAIGPTVRDL